MQFSAIFESWHVGDENYPPLSKGRLVNLSFECETHILEHASAGSSPRIEHLGLAECAFSARVLRVYTQSRSVPIAVLDAGDFRFYVYGATVTTFSPGDLLQGEGTILLDHYIWVEFLDSYPDPPDIFFNLRVSRIRKVQIPARFISRHEQGKAHPSRLGPSDFAPEDVEELETMNGQPFDEEFYIIDFDDTGLEGQHIARTFQ